MAAPWCLSPNGVFETMAYFYNGTAGNPLGFAPYKSDRDDGRRALRPQHDEVAFRPTQLALQVGGGTATERRIYRNEWTSQSAVARLWRTRRTSKHAFLRNEPELSEHENGG